MTATFENTVDILVRAYLDGTLFKGNCCACAVGNLCAAALGLQINGVFKARATGRDESIQWDNNTFSPAWAKVF